MIQTEGKQREREIDPLLAARELPYPRNCEEVHLRYSGERRVQVQSNNRNHELVQPRRGGRGTSGNRVKDEAKKYAEKWSEEEHTNAHIGGQMGPRVMMGEWEQRPYTATAKEAGWSSAATSGNDKWRCLMPSCGQCSQPSRPTAGDSMPSKILPGRTGRHHSRPSRPSIRMTAGRPTSTVPGRHRAATVYS